MKTNKHLFAVVAEKLKISQLSPLNRSTKREALFVPINQVDKYLNAVGRLFL